MCEKFNIPSVGGMLQHQTVSGSCPNCGTLCLSSELNYSSHIKTFWGGSTLYGVCAKCARAHSSQDERNWRAKNGINT